MINSQWKKKKLTELGFVGRGKSRHRPRDAEFLYGGPYAFIQTGEVKAADMYVREYSQSYSEDGLAQSKLWGPDTLMITIAANIAETAILKIPACFPDSIVGFVANPDESDVRFVKYSIDTLKLKMQNVSKGTTQDNLSLEKLATFDLSVPDLPTQRRIASILSAYDDLIENNTRRIKILEDMARLIYREWFVKFRAPGVRLRKATPEEKKVTGKDMFPVGWEVKRLFELAEVTYGYPFKSNLFTSEPLGKAVVRIRDIKSQDSGTYTPEEVDEKYIIKKGDLVVGMDGDFHMGKWAAGDAYLNQRVVRFRPRNGISNYYLFLALEAPITHFDSTIVGTTVAHLSDKDLRSIGLLNVPQKLHRRVLELFEPIFREEIVLRSANTNLRATRDLLLPKLISGEVKLK